MRVDICFCCTKKKQGSTNPFLHMPSSKVHSIRLFLIISHGDLGILTEPSIAQFSYHILYVVSGCLSSGMSSNRRSLLSLSWPSNFSSWLESPRQFGLVVVAVVVAVERERGRERRTCSGVTDKGNFPRKSGPVDFPGKCFMIPVRMISWPRPRGTSPKNQHVR